MAALLGAFALTASAAALADNGRRDYDRRWDDRGQGWGHQKHERWHHQHRYQPAPYGYVSIRSAPVYAPPAYYGDGYYYGAPAYYPRYSYPVAPSFSFGMTVPLD